MYSVGDQNFGWSFGRVLWGRREVGVCLEVGSSSGSGQCVSVSVCVRGALTMASTGGVVGTRRGLCGRAV